MAYNVSNDYRKVIYSGGAEHDAELKINNVTIPTSQISKIEFDNPMFDKEAKMFYLGQFASNQTTIYFKNMDNIPTSGKTTIRIGTKVNGTYEYVPMGTQTIDYTQDDYYKNNKLVCLDDAINMKPSIDISSMVPCTLEELLQKLCTHYNITLGTYPNTNKDYVVSTYDSTYSGKFYFSMIAELMGGNIKIGRDNKLNIIPLKHEHAVEIDATAGKEWKFENVYTISRVTYDDGKKYCTFGDDTGNTLFIRTDNIFVLDNYETLIENIYNSVVGTTIASVKTENYGDPSLDAYDIIKYKVDDKIYYTYNNAVLTFEMNIMSKLDTSIPSKVQEQTTNVIAGENTDAKIRKIQTTINQQDLSITTLVEEQKQIEKDTTTSKTASGNPIEIEDAGNYPLQSIEIEGKSVQETRSGKNLINNLLETQTLNGVSFNVNNDKSITINGTATARTEPNLWTNSSESLTLLNGITYYNYTGDKLYFLASNGYFLINDNGSYTPNADLIVDRIYIRVEDGTTVDKTIFPMLTTSTDSTYEQYGASPSPDYPSEIKSVKGIRNLFGLTTYINAYLDATGGLRNDTSKKNCLFEDYIEVKPNNTYTLSCNTVLANMSICEFDSSKSFIVRKTTKNTKINSFTTNSTTKYIRVQFNYDNSTAITDDIVNNLDIMLEKGSVAHDYVPYGIWLEQKTIGKNRFNKDKITKVRYLTNNGSLGQSVDWAISDYIDVIGGTNYTYQGLTDVGASPCSCYYDKDKKFISSFKQAIGVNTITIPSNAYYVRFSIKTSVSDENTFQFEKGNSTEYAPYTENIASIDMNKPNLKDDANSAGVYINAAGTTAGVTASDYSIYIPCKSNTYYSVVSSIQIPRFRICYVDDLITGTISINGMVIDNGTSKTFKTNDSAKYIYINLTSSDYLDELKIYESIEIDDYYRFASIGDTKDTFKDGILTQRIGKVVLDGSADETYVYVSNNSVNGYSQFDYTVNLPVPNAENYGENVISSHFEYYKEASTNLKEKAGVRIRSTNPYIVFAIEDTLASTVAEFKTWLSNNPVTVYYVLETPIEYTLTYEPLTLHKGYNYITLNDELLPNMNIEYLTDSKLNAEFTTKSEFNISNNLIKESVSAEIKELDKKTEASLELKVDEKDMMSQINAKADEINFESDKMTIKSSDFELKDGKIKAIGGLIGGFTLTEDKFSNNVNGIYNYSYGDARVCFAGYKGYIKLNNDIINIMDVNNSGSLELNDVTKAFRIASGTETSDKNVSGQFIIDSQNPKKFVSVKKDGNFILSIGLGGIDSVLGTFENIVVSQGESSTDNTGIYLSGGSGKITCVSLTQTSLEESKKNFEKLESGLEIIKNTDIYKYHLKNQNNNEKKHIGFVIGEKYKYAHEITSVDENSEKEIGVDTYSMTSVCFRAIQEQQEIIYKQDKRIKKLENQVKKILELVEGKK